MKTKKVVQKKMLVSVVVGLLVTGVAAGAIAQGSDHGQKKGRRGSRGRNAGSEMQLERMTKRLDLTADQAKAIGEIRETGRGEGQELRKQMLRLRNEQRGEMLKDNPSEEALLGLTTEIGDLRTRMQTARMSNRLAVRKVLTPEQRDKMLLAGKGSGGREGIHKRGQRGQRRSGRGGCDNSCAGQRSNDTERNGK